MSAVEDSGIGSGRKRKVTDQHSEKMQRSETPLSSRQEAAKLAGHAPRCVLMSIDRRCRGNADYYVYDFGECFGQFKTLLYAIFTELDGS